MNLSPEAASKARKLDDAINRRLAATREVERFAVHTLAVVMNDEQWDEIQVDIEGLSTVESILTSTGERRDAPDEIHDDDDLFTIIGNCPRRLFRYRDGEYRVTKDELARCLSSDAAVGR